MCDFFLIFVLIIFKLYERKIKKKTRKEILVKACKTKNYTFNSSKRDHLGAFEWSIYYSPDITHNCRQDLQKLLSVQSPIRAVSKIVTNEHIYTVD